MTTPVRLEDTLVRHAAAEAQVQRRSTPKQIEFWAEIGRAIAGEVTAEDLIVISQGIRKVKVEPVSPESVSSEDIWSEVEADRASGELARHITRDRIVYQASARHPGYLEAVYPDGQKITGQFRNGRFEPLNGQGHAA